MKLYLTNRSPFARKVMVMAIEKHLDSKIETIVVDFANKPKDLLDSNPLGAVPTLVCKDGGAFYDSPVICEYIDSLNDKPKLIPDNTKEKFTVLKIEALADGLTESAIKIFYERLRDEKSQDATLIKKHFDVIDRGLATLDKISKNFEDEKNFTLAEIAAAAALGYISFRLIDYKWQEKYPTLKYWFESFSERDSMKRTVPRL